MDPIIVGIVTFFLVVFSILSIQAVKKKKEPQLSESRDYDATADEDIPYPSMHTTSEILPEKKKNHSKGSVSDELPDDANPAQDVEDLISSLESDLNFCNEELSRLRNNLRIEQANRAAKLQKYVKDIIPDNSSRTIEKLSKLFPNFYVSNAQKGNMNLSLLRVQLGTYLDNLSEKPSDWGEIEALDDKIRSIQEEEIPALADDIDDIQSRIEALRKLKKANIAKLDPKVYRRILYTIHRSAKARRDGTYRYRRPNVNYDPYAFYPETDDDFLFEMWFWYQILTPSSVYNDQVIFEGGGGYFDGAGATDTYSQPTQDDQSPAYYAGAISENTQPDTPFFTSSADTSDSGSTVSQNYSQPDMNDVETHVSLGSFS